MGSEETGILTLAEPVVLYTDDSDESREVERLLQEAGIEFFDAHRAVEPPNRPPLLFHGGGSYQGVDQIREWLDLLRYLSTERPTSPSFLQEKTKRPA